jgi:hypothetical protein
MSTVSSTFPTYRLKSCLNHALGLTWHREIIGIFQQLVRQFAGNRLEMDLATAKTPPANPGNFPDPLMENDLIVLAATKHLKSIL